MVISFSTRGKVVPVFIRDIMYMVRKFYILPTVVCSLSTLGCSVFEYVESDWVFQVPWLLFQWADEITDTLNHYHRCFGESVY